MWRDVGAVYRKELRAYFTSPIPYIFMALFAAYMSLHFFFDDERSFFLYDKAEMYGGFFFQLERVLIVLVPIVGMGQWSAEFGRGTIETLMTLPVRTSALAIGKFLSAWTLIFVCLAATVTIPITVASLGDMDWGPVLTGYLGAFLFCGALLALGVWVSSLTRHQIVAFVLTLVAGVVFVGMYEFADKVGSFFGPVCEKLSLASHYQSMGRGVIDLRDVAYFVSFIAFFLYLNTQTVENRRYR